MVGTWYRIPVQIQVTVTVGNGKLVQVDANWHLGIVPRRQPVLPMFMYVYGQLTLYCVYSTADTGSTATQAPRATLQPPKISTRVSNKQPGISAVINSTLHSRHYDKNHSTPLHFPAIVVARSRLC
jgi:hypothetical protein